MVLATLRSLAVNWPQRIFFFFCEEGQVSASWRRSRADRVPLSTKVMTRAFGSSASGVSPCSSNPLSPLRASRLGTVGKQRGADGGGWAWVGSEWCNTKVAEVVSFWQCPWVMCWVSVCVGGSDGTADGGVGGVKLRLGRRV